MLNEEPNPLQSPYKKGAKSRFYALMCLERALNAFEDAREPPVEPPPTVTLPRPGVARSQRRTVRGQQDPALPPEGRPPQEVIILLVIWIVSEYALLVGKLTTNRQVAPPWGACVVPAGWG